MKLETLDRIKYEDEQLAKAIKDLGREALMGREKVIEMIERRIENDDPDILGFSEVLKDARRLLLNSSHTPFENNEIHKNIKLYYTFYLAETGLILEEWKKVEVLDTTLRMLYTLVKNRPSFVANHKVTMLYLEKIGVAYE